MHVNQRTIRLWLAFTITLLNGNKFQLWKYKKTSYELDIRWIGIE